MELKYNKLDKLLVVIYEHPGKQFTVRALAKAARLPTATVQLYLKSLKKQGFVNADNMASDTQLFRIKKINHFVEKIVASGLLDYLVQTYHPSCVILFGSIRKGDSMHESDIDIFMETAGKSQSVPEKFEKILHHKVQLFIEPDIHKLPDNLFNNVINGIKLYGSFSIK